ncbi:MAG: GGDEF domain-containing protein [Desulforegulaceae bacterium]|nr:GGDEF domain-containing protein [Desulforegulaceae bacterium]
MGKFQVNFTKEIFAAECDNLKIEYTAFQEMIKSELITSHAQPIIDLYTGQIKGFELLARGIKPFYSPDLMFEKARKFNLEWELEYACREAALKKINILSKTFGDCDFFINVSPDIFSNEKFQSGFTLNKLKKYSIDPKKIVLEITESASVKDYSHYEAMIKHYVRQGFRIALDDFGSGYSGFTTLIASTPHILKIDKSIVKDIDRISYKQNLVRSICEFASTVGSFILLEGIETEEELKMAYRLGVRYAQGFFFAKPENNPTDLDLDKKKLLKTLIKQYSKKTSSVEISIFKLISKPPTFVVKSLLCKDLDLFFKNNPEIDHIIIIDEKNYPNGLITRQDFYSYISGRYGYSVFENKFAEKTSKKNMLIVSEDTDLRILGKLTMNRKKNEIYDPVVIIDMNNRFLGTITMETVISRAFDTEIKFATSANPLTSLPGNIVINVWMEEILKKDAYSIAYLDLDRFKEYNDNYGFSSGDEMIKLLACVLDKAITDFYPESKLGHIGGDDFVIISESILEDSFYETICKNFDAEKKRLFLKEDIENGFYFCENRKGEKECIPLVTLSIAIITSKNIPFPVHPGKLAQCIALLKGKIKSINNISKKSGFMCDRRVYDFF